MDEKRRTQHDVFISYASEDREAVARPLADVLETLGATVWFDEYELKIGDSLRRTVDAGLASCRYGIVVLSEAFFGKHYPNRELDGLAQREVAGENVILPIWFGVDDIQVRRFSLPLADRVAARWTDGFPSVLLKVLQVVRPDILEALQTSEFEPLPRLRTGSELAAVIGAAEFYFFRNDDPSDQTEADLIGSFLDELQDWADIWSHLDAGDIVRASFTLAERIEALDSAGFWVYGAHLQGEREFLGHWGNWRWCLVAVVRASPVQVFHRGDGFVVVR